MAARCGDVDTVAWLDSFVEEEGEVRRVRFRRFRHGVPLDPPDRVIETDDRYPWELHLTCGATTVLLTWRSGEASGAAFLGDEVRTLGPGRIRSHVAPAFDGHTYFTLTREPDGSWVARKWNEAGEQLLARPLDDSDRIRDAALASNGSELLVVRSEASERPYVLYAMRVDRELHPVGARVELAPAISSDFLRPRIAASPFGWLVAWRPNSLDAEVRSVRLTRSGALLDPPGGFPSGASDVYGGNLALSWNGRAYEVLTERMLVTRSPGGATSARTLLDEGDHLFAISASGARRFLVSGRVDEADAAVRLHGAFVDASRWDVPASPRQRAVRK